MTLSWATVSGPIGGTVVAVAIVVLVTSELRRAQGRPRPLLVDLCSIVLGSAALVVAALRPVLG